MERAEDALTDLRDLPVTRHTDRCLTGAIFGRRESFSASDAAYVALAGALGATLVTLDRPLQRMATAVAGIAVEPTAEEPGET